MAEPVDAFEDGSGHLNTDGLRVYVPQHKRQNVQLYGFEKPDEDLFSVNGLSQKAIKEGQLNLTRHRNGKIQISSMMDNPAEGKHVCPYCKVTFIHKFVLSRHIKQIHEKHKLVNYKCPKCEYNTVRKDQMRSHYSVVHEEFKPYGCSMCNFRAPKSFRVTSHIEKAHGGQGAVIHDTKMRPKSVSPTPREGNPGMSRSSGDREPSIPPPEPPKAPKPPQPQVVYQKNIHNTGTTDNAPSIMQQPQLRVATAYQPGGLTQTVTAAPNQPRVTRLPAGMILAPNKPAAQGRPMVLQAGPNGQQVLRPLLSTTTGTALPAGSIVVGPTPVVTTGTPQNPIMVGGANVVRAVGNPVMGGQPIANPNIFTNVLRQPQQVAMCQPVPAPALATAAGKPRPQVIILNAAGQPTVIQAQTAVAQATQANKVVSTINHQGPALKITEARSLAQNVPVIRSSTQVTNSNTGIPTQVPTGVTAGNQRELTQSNTGQVVVDHRPPELRERKPYACEICAYTTKSQLLMGDHVFFTHNRLAITDAVKEDMWSVAPSVDPKAIYPAKENHPKIIPKEELFQGIKCNLCPHKVKSKIEMYSHVKNSHPQVWEFYVCKYCPMQFYKESLYLDHVRVRHPGKKRDYVCPSCFLSVDNAGALFYHVYTNHGSQKILLKALLLKYGSEAQKVQYQKAVANVTDEEAKARLDPKTAFGLEGFNPTDKRSDTGIKCTACVQSFGDRPALLRHVSKDHPNIKDFFVCSHCPSQFTVEKVFAHHVKMMHPPHERDIRCKICYAPFAQPRYLFIHMRDMHIKIFVGISNKDGSRTMLENNQSSITFAQKCLKTDLGKYGLPKDQKEFAVHTGDQEFIEKVDKLAGGETKITAAGGDGEKSKKVVNPAAPSFSRTSSPDIDESPDEVPSGATSPGVPRTDSTSPEVITDDHDEGPKMKRVKIEGIGAPPKVTATLELEEDPEIFDLSSGSSDEEEASKAALESGEVKDEVDDDEFAEVVGKTTEDILDEIDNLMADNDDEEDEEADPDDLGVEGFTISSRHQEPTTVSGNGSLPNVDERDRNLQKGPDDKNEEHENQVEMGVDDEDLNENLLASIERELEG